MATNIISQDELKALLHYDPDTGVFTWRVNRKGGVKVGDTTGYIAKNGYVQIGVSNKLYYAHRLVWLYVYGVWPEYDIDHIDGVRANNKLVNLRKATRTENNQNTRKDSTNVSGLRGVYWHRAAQKWCAEIAVKGKKTYLGLFNTKELAHEAYLKAKETLHEFQPTPR